ncbi:PAS domain-containing protein [Archangium minus]|uniref:histidine kinase n=1 Tax=Archangium minus TaxID=83450 RepID=A0ABY9WTE2_9BACT|nr:PAS domain-containing protein [Archangium minus]
MGNTQRVSRSGVPRPSPGLFRFTLAVGATVVGLLLTGLLVPFLGGTYFLLALAVVALCSLYGGLASGLLVTLLSGLGFCYFFFPPVRSFRVSDSRDLLRLAVFWGVASVLCWVGASLRRTLEQTRARLAERERADRELRDANAWAVAILESISDAFFSLDRRYHFTVLNGEAERLLGRKRQELVGKCIWVEFAEAIGSTFQREYQRVLDTGRPVQFVEFYPPLHAWFEVRAFPSRDGLSVFFRDISERRGAEERLRQSEERFRSLVLATSQVVWTTNAEGRPVEDSPTWCAFTGQPREEFLGGRWLDAVHPEDRERAVRAWRDSLAYHTVFEVQYRLRRPDGSYTPTLARGAPVLNPDGSLREWVGANTDISRSVSAEQALRESERRYHLLASNCPDGLVALYDHDLRYIVVEGTDLQGMGLSRTKMEGHTIWEVLEPETCAAIEGPMRAAFTGHSQVIELPFAGRTYRAHYLPVRNEAGEVMAGMLMSQNITELKALQEQLEQRVRERTRQLDEANQELEAFAYSVSHDLRTPLRGIDGFTQAVEDDDESTLSPAARNYLRRVRRASERMAQLIDDLLKLSRLSRAELRRAPVDITALAHEVVAELAAREPQRSVEVRIQPSLRDDADPRLVRILLENLLGNAWKFTGRVERPWIELSATRQEDPPIYCVRDNGAGFDMAYAGKLFAPFQRLHSEAEFPGTGIGLATVLRVVRRHGGHIRAESAPGQGASFFFTLRG